MNSLGGPNPYGHLPLPQKPEDQPETAPYRPYPPHQQYPLPGPVNQPYQPTQIAQPPFQGQVNPPTQSFYQHQPRSYFPQFPYFSPLNTPSSTASLQSAQNDPRIPSPLVANVMNQTPQVASVPPALALIQRQNHPAPSIALAGPPQQDALKPIGFQPNPFETNPQTTPMLEGPSLGRPKGKKIKAADPTQEDSIEQLKRLTAKASEIPLAELALRLKMLGTRNPNIDSDPIFKSLNNAKDLKQEKHHQVFGMVWIKTVCEASPTAVVPRNRVYARYVQLCANNNLSPLTPAAFGKLIRILHPNLKTRRLGMRGKSKYHYCGIKVIDDNSLENTPLPHSSAVCSESPHSLNPQTPSYSRSPSLPSAQGTPIDSAAVREAFMTNGYRYVPNLFFSIENTISQEWMAQPFTLPSIQAYLTNDADVDDDIADTLHSLYRVHCMSIFEAFRFMQVEKLLSSFASFCGILTSPVFRLYTSSKLIEWVRACDLALYRAMMKMLTRLQLQPVPDEIMTPLQEFAAEYCNRLSAELQTRFPADFVHMKMVAARQFVAILRRFARCIELGSSAAKVLSSSTERALMLSDWLRVDTHEIILREVPCAPDNMQLFDEIFNDRIIKLFEEESPQADKLKASGLAPYAAFFLELPSRFPQTSPWLFSLVCSNLLTTCLREMSLAGGQSFGSWWVFRCWADEFVMWFFELGHYLYGDEDPVVDQKTTEEEPLTQDPGTNASWAFEPSLPENLRTASIVDLLDLPTGETKPYSESDWF